jgi:Ohr subfamily peroxiredoxin
LSNGRERGRRGAPDAADTIVSRTDDERLSVQLSSPGSRATGTNPEQLFAIGWSACFLSAVQLVAGKMKIRLAGDPTDDVEVDLCLSSSEGASLRVRHNVTLPGVDGDTARAIVERAHKECPYSKATRGNIEVETRIVPSP